MKERTCLGNGVKMSAVKKAKRKGDSSRGKVARDASSKKQSENVIPFQKPSGKDTGKAITNSQQPKKDPMEKALELLEEYDVGIPPYQPGVDHWGD